MFQQVREDFPRLSPSPPELLQVQISHIVHATPSSLGNTAATPVSGSKPSARGATDAAPEEHSEEAAQKLEHSDRE